jgi:ketosteroid isomerase-like protein
MSESPKTVRVPFYKLIASGVDLASAFKSAVDAFNGQDLDKLMYLCDDNVVLATVKRQEAYSGKAAVAAYLATRFALRKPRFTPTTTNTTINPGGTVGHILGTADWSDLDPGALDGAQIDGSICYAFNFVSRGNGWLISTLWGSADHLTQRP